MTLCMQCPKCQVKVKYFLENIAKTRYPHSNISITIIVHRCLLISIYKRHCIQIEMGDILRDIAA